MTVYSGTRSIKQKKGRQVRDFVHFLKVFKIIDINIIEGKLILISISKSINIISNKFARVTPVSRELENTSLTGIFGTNDSGLELFKASKLLQRHL